MKLRNIVIALSFIAVFVGCDTYKYNVLKVDKASEPPKSFGLYYSLPRNVITIDITVTKTDKIAGPYAAYASKYLGIKNALKTNTTSYDLTDIKINTYSEPDPDQFYFIDLGKMNATKSRSIMMSLSEAGLIQDFNDNSDEAVMQEKREEMKKDRIDYSQTFKYFADANLKELVDTLIEKISVDTLILEKQVLKRSLVEKTMEEKAKEAADFILHVQDQRFDILTGAQEVAYSEATISLMNNELKALEEEYMELFVGITNTSTFHYRYYYLPESEVYNASIPLFKFSTTMGIMAEDASGGDLVFIKVDRARNTMNLEDFIAKNNPEKEEKRGLYYRIPEYSKFTIMQGDISKAEASFLISQFGVIGYLPPKYTKLQLYPNTGAIRKIDFE